MDFPKTVLSNPTRRDTMNAQNATVITPDALTLYERMRAEFDYEPVYRVAEREYGLDREKAQEMLDAFLQWFSLIPFVARGSSLQMLGSVDRIWHSFILNMRLYENFCRSFVGDIVYHDALDPDNTDEPKEGYARSTVALLRQMFGDKVHPELLRLEDNEVTCCFFKTETHFGANCSKHTDTLKLK